MAKSVLTPEIEQFIRDNYLKMSGTAIAEKFGIHKSVVNRYKRKNNLIVPRATILEWRSAHKKGRTTFTQEEDEFIKDNYLTTPIKTLAKQMGRSSCGVIGRMKVMGLKVPPELAKKRKEKGMIRKGHVPFNKGRKQEDYMTQEAIEKSKETRFKKGNLPHNAYEEDGIISIREDKSGVHYKYIRVALGNWQLLQRVEWEKHKGSIPEGYVIAFKNGDTMNCDISNLEMISRAELMKRNQIHKYPEELQRVIKLKNKLKRAL